MDLRLRELACCLEEFFRGVKEHRPDCEALLFDMLRHLAIGINSIHMVLDCDVVLGGFLSEYLQAWLPALQKYVTAGNPFNENAGLTAAAVRNTDRAFSKIPVFRKNTA